MVGVCQYFTQPWVETTQQQTQQPKINMVKYAKMTSHFINIQMLLQKPWNQNGIPIK